MKQGIFWGLVSYNDLHHFITWVSIGFFGISPMTAVVLRKKRWLFQIYFLFTPILGEDSHFDTYVSNGLVQPPTGKSINHDKSPINHHLEKYFPILNHH